ncbi:MAG: methionine biosynthesis protein MetW, partial [Sphingomonadaceae bacterium]|nr:methionine biosynthesis protein MetW [Sphingomonadaceae bacterium]
VSWYETQNIHHVTVADFLELARDLGVTVEESWYFAGDREIGAAGANWRAEYAVFRVSG